jgi:hypothetical protein
VPLTGVQPVGAELGDVDSDGHLDLVLADASQGRLLVLPGAGDGTFGPSIATPVGPFPGPHALADWNGDGNLDAAVGHRLSGTPGQGELRVLFGDGAGAFPASASFVIPVGANDVDAPDLDGDGLVDLAVGCAGDVTNGGVVLLRSKGSGLFEELGKVLAGARVRAFAIADLDADGARDLVAVDDGLQEGLVAAGVGLGAFGEPITWPVVGLPAGVSVADADGDGAADVVVTHGAAFGGRATVVRQR